jgi:hypothetical protein
MGPHPSTAAEWFGSGQSGKLAEPFADVGTGTGARCRRGCAEDADGPAHPVRGKLDMGSAPERIRMKDNDLEGTRRFRPG